MRSFIWGVVFLFFVLSACSQKDNFAYPDLLAKSDAKMNAVVIVPNDTYTPHIPSFMDDFVEHSISIIIVGKNNFNNQYPDIQIEHAPAYIYLDANGILFKTDDEDEAKAFYEEKIVDSYVEVSF